VVAVSLVKEFHEAGWKLSAILPFVLRAYVKAKDGAELLTASMEEAARGVEAAEAGKGEKSDGLRGALLAAADRIEHFRSTVNEMRRLTLEAIVDQERGPYGPNRAQMGLERSRQKLLEAADLLRQGQLEAASQAHAASRRSIADSLASLRSRIARMQVDERGLFLPGALEEEAARLGPGWQARTRGEDLSAEMGRYLKGSEEMPFPARFRDLVRIYLRAISEGRP